MNKIISIKQTSFSLLLLLTSFLILSASVDDIRELNASANEEGITLFFKGIRGVFLMVIGVLFFGASAEYFCLGVISSVKKNDVTAVAAQGKATPPSRGSEERAGAGKGGKTAL